MLGHVSGQLHFKDEKEHHKAQRQPQWILIIRDSLSWCATWMPRSWRSRRWWKLPGRTHIYTWHRIALLTMNLTRTCQLSEITWLIKQCLQQVCDASTRVPLSRFGAVKALRWWLWHKMWQTWQTVAMLMFWSSGPVPSTSCISFPRLPGSPSSRHLALTVVIHIAGKHCLSSPRSTYA